MSVHVPRTIPRPHTEPVRRLRRLVRAMAPADPDEDIATHDERPRTRGECVDGVRPCPWLSCRHHLGLDVKPNGAVRLTFADREPWAIPETCSLDVAERGEHILEDVGALLNLSKERARQVIIEAIAALVEPLGPGNT